MVFFGACCCRLGWPEGQNPVCCGGAYGCMAWSGLVWIVQASDYLFSSRAASWIGPPDYALLEETLARGLGLWPVPKLGLILLLLVVLRRWGGLHRLFWP